ncbi:MAG: M24 family metallopeptidase [Thermodesulfobacteriota bacterium]
MAELVTELTEIEKITGLNVMDDLIYPSICLDSTSTAIPIILIKNGKKYLLCRAVEKACIEEKAIRGFGLVWYNPYFMFDDRKKISKVERDLATAIKQIISEDSVYLHEDISYGIYFHLKDNHVNSEIMSLRDLPALTLYRIPVKEVVDRCHSSFQEWKCLAEGALGLFDKDRQKKLKPYLEKPRITGFEDLDRLMTKLGINIICANTTIDLQDLVGIPLRRVPKGILALYHLNAQEVYVASPEELEFSHFQKVGVAEPGESLIRKLYGEGRVGVGIDLPLSMAKALQTDLMNLKLATSVFRSWREGRSLEDLPYYLLGAQATREAVEGALEFAEMKILAQENLSEIDIFHHYLRSLEEFPKKLGANVYFEKYFANLHATSRTLYPSVPGDFPVNSRTHCIRFDTGILAFDERGFLKAATDIGRGMVLKEPGKKLYEILQKTIDDRIIPSLRPGRKGKDIYRQIIEELLEHETKIKQMQLMHDHTSLEQVYKRNVGHLLGRQEPTSLNLTETQDQELQEGMVGAIEFPWLFGDYAIGYEDMFLVAQEGGINISSGG